MTLVPIDIPPGIVRRGTQYQTKGRWYDGNLVRWSNGRLQPIGGWERVSAIPQISQRICGMLAWKTPGGALFLAIGHTRGMTIWDGAILSAGGAQDVSVAAFSGLADIYVPGLGYGIFEYGYEEYGTSRTPNYAQQIAAGWSLDSYGSKLLAVLDSEGELYEFDGENDDPATDDLSLVSAGGGSGASVSGTVPQNNKGVLVTDERHVILIGAGGDGRRIQWCSQDDLYDWDVTSVTNSAGYLDLDTPGGLISGIRTKYGSLIFSSSDVWRLNYLGFPLVYGAERISGAGGIISPRAAAGNSELIAWMGRDAFWSYNGYVQPLQCDVADYVFSDINSDVSGLVSALHNEQDGEIWWFYPSSGSTVCDRYVFWSYRENYWSIGRLGRCVGVGSDVWGDQYWAGTDGYIYKHEQAGSTVSRDPSTSEVSTQSELNTVSLRQVSAGGAGASEAGLVYVESGAFEMGPERTMKVRRVITDVDAGDANSVRMKFKTRFAPDNPGASADTEHGPYYPAPDGYTDVRFSGRQAVLRIEAPFDQDFRIGTLRLDAIPGGTR